MGGHNESSSTTIPRIMVFRPTLEEMKDFSKYIAYMESQGADKAGLAKIIPPSEWCPRKNGYEDIDVVIKSPIQQVVEGGQGMYQQYNIQKRSMTAKEFKKMAESAKYNTPQFFDYDELERKYWKNITYNAPIYGADVPGTITDDDCEEFNINKLNTILDLINESYGIKIMGVNTAYLYFGMWKTTFAWHTEDMDLYSINYLHFGAPKSWYCIPPEHGRRLERLATGYFPNSKKTCPAFLRHKMTLISPQVLRNNSIPYNKITQEPGEFMITFPYSYHAGYNHGYNCAESTNFALPRWVEFGKRATRCMCRKDSVQISMDVFVKKFQPDRYELWLAGKDIGEDPKDPGHHSAAPAPSSYELDVFGKRSKRHPPHKKEYSSDTEEYDSDETQKSKLTCMPTKAQRKMFFESQPNQEMDHAVTYPNQSGIPTIEETIIRIKNSISSSALTQDSKRKKRKKTNNVPPHLLNHSYAKSCTRFCFQPNVGPFDVNPFQSMQLSSGSSTVNGFTKLTSSNTQNSFNNLSQLPQPSTSSNTFEQDKTTSTTQTINSNLQPSFLTFNSSSFENLVSETSKFNKNFSPQSSQTISTGAMVNRSPPNLKPYYYESSPSKVLNSCASPPTLLENSFLNLNKQFSSQNFKDFKVSLFPNLLSASTSEPSKITKLKTEKMIERSTQTDSEESSEQESIDNLSYQLNNDTMLENLIKKTLQYAPHTGQDTIDIEVRFNNYMSTIEPHCAVCTLLKPFKPEKQFDEAFLDHWYPPKNSSVLIPSVAFTSKVSNENTVIDCRDTSPLLVCMDCRVCVHAVCYGVSDLLFDGSEKNWKCDRCVKNNYFASCCLCPILGGPLKEVAKSLSNEKNGHENANTNTKLSGPDQWVHLTCALLIPEVKFVNGITKKPIDISIIKKTKKKAACIYCKMKNPENKITDYLTGYCIQCNNGKCSSQFHVTCGHREGVEYKASDWPIPITIHCVRCVKNKAKNRIVKRDNLIEVDVGSKIIAKHKNRRYYNGVVVEKINQIFHHVHFVDNSFTENLKSCDFLSHDCEKSPPQKGDSVEVIWNKDQLSGRYSGSHSCLIYTIMFDDGSQVKTKREEFYLSSEELPKRVRHRVSQATEMKNSN